MENVILIKVESLTDLEPTNNFFVLDMTTGELYRGNDTGIPIKILDEKSPTFYANQFMFYGG